MIGPHPLLGKVIASVHLTQDGKAIRFDLLDGEQITALADGGCCSLTWIENVEGAQEILGSPVLSVEDVSMPVREEKRYYGEVIAFYGCKIRTALGEMLIDYRNESNGYYGGNLSWPGDYYYGGVFKQNVPKYEWRKLA